MKKRLKPDGDDRAKNGRTILLRNLWVLFECCHGILGELVQDWLRVNVKDKQKLMNIILHRSAFLCIKGEICKLCQKHSVQLAKAKIKQLAKAKIKKDMSMKNTNKLAKILLKNIKDI